MDVENVKVLGNDRRILVNLKKKQAAQSANNFTGAYKLVTQKVMPDESSDRRCKRVRLGGCKNSCKCNFRKSIVKNYLSFKKSGLPQRVLCYQNGDWKDVPEEIFIMLKGEFLAKKVASEVVFKGRCYLFDFLHMVQIDIETGLQQPIAWIDESGGCYFPELYSDCNEVPGSFASKGNGINSDHNGSHGIELQLEIAISNDDNSVSDECNESPVSHSKRIKIDFKPDANFCELKQDFAADSKRVVEHIEGFGENVPSLDITPQTCAFESKHGKFERLVVGGSDYNAIQKMFLLAFGPSANVNDIVGIFQGSPTSILVQTRLQFFQKQIEIMRTYRGDANACYAWFASPKESISRIMFHRFDHTDMRKTESAYGTGLNMTPVNCTHVSANHFDVDENGVHYVLLCRVIMGNSELIRCGSEQFQPSNENYDSGVDDLKNPKHYIIWDMNMNSHVYPEYVVSFKMSPSVKEPLIVRESKIDMSVVTHSTHPSCHIQRNSTPVDSVSSCQQFSTLARQSQEKTQGLGLHGPRLPTSPWMSFPMLLAAISSKLLRKDMDLIDHHYDKFKRKTISRMEFIEKLRYIVGDDLLRSTIKGMKYNTPANLKCEP